MGLFWKRTKKEETEQPAEQEQKAQAAEASQEPAEQKGGFFQRFFGKTESAGTAPVEQPPAPPEPPPTEPDIVRAPEQEKKSFWDRWGWGQEGQPGQPGQPKE